MKKLLAHFDSIEHPTIPQLAVGTIFETLARNSEIRALRFKDFHFDAEQPYVRICGMATGNKRENRGFFGAMALINENADIYATANLLGHSTISMTKKYSDKLNNSRINVGPQLA